MPRPDDSTQIPEDDPNDIDVAWGVEIERRLRQYREGRVKAVPGEQVFADLDDIIENSSVPPDGSG